MINLKNNENSDNNEYISENTMNEVDIGGGARTNAELGGFTFVIEENTSEATVKEKTNNDNENGFDELVSEN